MAVALSVSGTALAQDTGGGLVEADFYWDADTKKFKRQIIKAVNRIHREDSRCRHRIEPGTVTKSVTRSKAAGQPVFFVMCGEGASIVNVFFDLARANDPAPFKPPVHIARDAAVELCENYAKSKAVHASTVSFSRLWDMAITEHPNGRTTVLSTFTAKNSFNLEIKYTIRCLLDETRLIEGTIHEAS